MFNAMSRKDITMENNNSIIFDTIKNDFCVAVKKCLNQFKKNGYYKNTFENYPELLTALSQKLFDYLQSVLTGMPDNSLGVRMECPNFPISNDQFVSSSLSDDDKMQADDGETYEISDDESSIDEDADLNKDKRVEKVEEAVILSDQSDQDEQIDEDNEPTKKRVSGCLKRKINYFDDDDADEQSSSNTDNREDDEDYFEDHGQHFLLQDKDYFEDEDHQSEEDVGDSQSSSKKRHMKRSKINYDDQNDADENLSPNNREANKSPDGVQQQRKTVKRKSNSNDDPKKINKSTRGRPKKYTTRKYYSEPPKPVKISLVDKLKLIDEWVYKKYLECKKNDEKSRIRSTTYQIWGRQAKKELFPSDSLQFNASKDWILRFKRSYDIPMKKAPVVKLNFSREEKAKIVKLYDDHPYWSSNELSQASGYDSKYFIKSKINNFRLQLQKVDTPTNYDKIRNWVYREFLKHKQHGDALTDELLIELGQKAKEKLNLPPISFCAGKVKWLPNFKKKFNITGKPDNLQIMNPSFQSRSTKSL